MSQDVVYVYAVVEGWAGKELNSEEFYRAYHPRDINGRNWRAISWTTAASVAAVVEMVANGSLANKGFIKQEDIALDAFYATRWGRLYADEQMIKTI